MTHCLRIKTFSFLAPNTGSKWKGWMGDTEMEGAQLRTRPVECGQNAFVSFFKTALFQKDLSHADASLSHVGAKNFGPVWHRARQHPLTKEREPQVAGSRTDLLQKKRADQKRKRKWKKSEVEKYSQVKLSSILTCWFFPRDDRVEGGLISMISKIALAKEEIG